MERLLQDLSVAILCRLPAKDLVRLRCVSKGWRSLIESPDFISAHLHHQRRNSSTFILRGEDSDTTLCWEDNLDDPETSVHLEIPLDVSPAPTRFSCPSILSSCNGLVILTAGPIPHLVCLVMNPSIRRFKRVPLPQHEISLKDCFPRLGFGYDSANHGFKLVMIAQPTVYKTWLGVHNVLDARTLLSVYSLNSGSWTSTRILHDFPYSTDLWPLRNRGDGVLLGNTLHWLVSRRVRVYDSNDIAAQETRDLVMLSFDLATEEFGEVAIPESKRRSYEQRKYEYYSIRLDVIRGCLSMVFEKEYDADITSLEVWVMKEYGVKNSWAKLFPVGSTQCILERRRCREHELDVGGGARVALNTYGKSLVALYREKRVEKIWPLSCTIQTGIDAQVCLESLVGLDQLGRWDQVAEIRDIPSSSYSPGTVFESWIGIKNRTWF